MSSPALKDLRADLTSHLAAGLDATAPMLGQLVNPPAVVVQPGSPYVSPLPGYCADLVQFDATIIAPPGDMAAVVDALDDMIDEVRATLRTRSSLGTSDGFLYGFREVSGPIGYPAGDEKGTTLPAVVVTVAMERQSP